MAATTRIDAEVEPMLATLTDERDLSDDEWVLERKLDGVRCLAFVQDGVAVLRSRNGLVLDFPGIASALAPLDDAIVDGEIVAMDADGQPLGFQALQGRHTAAALWAFDLLRIGGEDLRSRPQQERHARLAAVLPTGPTVQLSTPVPGPSREAHARACAAGWEGLIAKRRDAPYRGGRSRDWLKLKCVLEQEVVIGGFTEPRGSRAGLGALLIGYYEDGALRYAGRVGTGFDAATLVALRRRLDELETTTPPFDEPVKPPAGTHWVRPELVAQVGFAEWTNAGRMRQPRFLGLRTDKAPQDVVRERPQ
jgi:bifunctional non-homologous end joining protein LigD